MVEMGLHALSTKTRHTLGNNVLKFLAHIEV